MNDPSRVLFLLAVVLSIGMVLPDDARCQQPPVAEQEFLEPFRGEPDKRVQLWGPEAAKFVKYEPEGLRVTLPTGYGGERPFTGVSVNVGVKGDFEIAVSYEILMEPPSKVSEKASMKLTLMAVLDRKQFNPLVLSRIQTGEGEPRFSTFATLLNPDTGKSQTKGTKQFPADAKKGRLRMVRKGKVLSSFAMQEPETKFRFLKEFPWIPEEDVKFVRVVASTGAEKASLDVRFSDLSIRWGSAKVAEAAKGQGVESDRPEGQGSRGWLIAVIVIGTAVILLFGLLLGAVLYFRRQKLVDATTTAIGEQETPVAAMVVCSGCAKKLKIAPEQAGKKVKCPHCGQAVVS